MTASIATLKAANPTQPMQAAAGPDLADRAAPAAQPEAAPLTISCLPRYLAVSAEDQRGRYYSAEASFHLAFSEKGGV